MEEKAQKVINGDNSEGIAEEFVARAFTEFNKWHGHEAVAELIKLEGPSIVVELSGPFCRTCGLYDYFDDLKFELEKVLGKPLEIAHVNSGGDERCMITYRIGGAQGGWNEKCEICGSVENLLWAKNEKGKIIYICESCHNRHV